MLTLLLLPLAGASEHVAWDDSRWFVATEVGLPRPVWFNQSGPFGFECTAFQVRAALSCDLGGEAHGKLHAVTCTFDDVGLQVVGLARSEHDDPAHTAAAVTELRDKLAAATVAMEVDDSGRVARMALEGVDDKSRRDAQIRQTLKMVVDRALVGFDWKRPTRRQDATGQWAGFDVGLSSLPTLDDTRPRGNAQLVHQRSTHEGRALLQVQGRGTATLPQEGAELLFEVGVSAVASFDGEASLAERVWDVQGTERPPTPVPYWHRGRLRRLGDETPEVGPSREVYSPLLPPDANRLGLPAWPPLEGGG